jgi:hypothetical protein
MYYPPGSTNSIIPAGPDWAVAQLDSGTDGLFLTPVIAWFLVAHVGDYMPGVKAEPALEKSVGVDVYPITVEGVEDEVTALKAPDGTFSIPNIRGGMNSEQCVAELKTKPA